MYHPKSFYPCSTNLRNTPEWKQVFESFGEFYKNPDLGFVITPDEVKTVMETMDRPRRSFYRCFSFASLSALPPFGSGYRLEFRSESALLISYRWPIPRRSEARDISPQRESGYQ